MENNLISIIVPIYNSENYIKKCLDSILAQTYSNLEVILIDDGSTDNSYNICKDYQKKDNRIVLLQQKNAGVSRARNHGLEVAKGEYIGFVDSDDYIEPEMYEILLNSIIESNSKIAICNYYYENEDSKEIKNFQSESRFFSRDYFTENMFNDFCINGFLCNKLYYRGLLFNKNHTIYLDENIKILEDNLFNYYIYDLNEKFDCVYINKKCYHYVQYINSACNKKINNIKLQYFFVREKQIEILNKNKKGIDALKADYVINYVKTIIKYNYLGMEKDSQIQRIGEQTKKFKKQIRINNLSKRTKIKYIISVYFPFLYWFYILINKENI